MSRVKARPPAFVLSADDHATLRRWIRAGTTPQRVARRARIVLFAASGWSDRAIATRLMMSPHTVRLWRRRYQSGGVASLLRDAPGRGRKPTATSTDTIAAVRRLLESPATSRWTVRRLAQAANLSRASAHRILRALSTSRQAERR